jgi:hypothetical protein
VGQRRLKRGPLAATLFHRVSEEQALVEHEQICVVIKSTGVLFIVSNIAAFSLYFGLRALLNQPPVIIWVPFAHLTFYHDQHPVLYLLSISLIFALIGALWLTVIAPKFSRLHQFQMALLPILTVLVTGPVLGHALGV